MNLIIFVIISCQRVISQSFLAGVCSSTLNAMFHVTWVTETTETSVTASGSTFAEPNCPRKMLNRYEKFREKTKGQQLKGKTVSALLRTVSHFSTPFHTFSEFFRIGFLKMKAFLKRAKKEKDQTILHVICCTFVLL